MLEILMQYGFFLAKAVTIVAAIGIVMVLAVTLTRKSRPMERLDVKNLNEKYTAMAQTLRRGILSKKDKNSAIWIECENEFLSDCMLELRNLKQLP